MTTIATYFTLPPDWAEGVKYSRAWRTSISATAQGVEQRSALWTWPRRSLEYTVAGLSYGESAYMKRKFYQGQGAIYGVPLWTSKTTLSSEATAGQSMVVVVAATGSEFVVGGQLILLGSDPDTYELGEIEVFFVLDPGPPDYTPILGILLKGNLAATWPAGTLVCPVLPCRIRAEQQVEALTAEVVKTVIEAEEAFES